MPGMLTRSKSLRFLKSGRKDAHEQDHGNSMQPPKTSHKDLDKLRSDTPISKVEARLEAPGMAVRPSTSGGPGDRTTMFHKKTNAAPSEYSHNHVFASASPMISTTEISPGEDITKEQGIIGIALGSPTVGSHWNSTPQAASFDTSSQTGSSMLHLQHPNGSTSSVGNRQVPPKSKLSRWKSLFRKAAPPPVPQEKPSFYQLTQTVAAAPRADSHHDQEQVEVQVASKQEKERIRRVLPPTYNPGIRASRRGAPDGFIVPRSPPEPPSARERALTLGSPATSTRPTMKIQRAFTTPNPPGRDEYFGVPQVVVSGSKGQSASGASVTSSSEEQSLLDVSIPDVTMERYSVMFGNLLQTGTNRSSSLLARRQANTEKIKPLNALPVKVREDVLTIWVCLLTVFSGRGARESYGLQDPTQSNISSNSVAFSTTFALPVHKHNPCTVATIRSGRKTQSPTQIENGTGKVSTPPDLLTQSG